MMMRVPDNDAFDDAAETDELAAYLDALARADDYVVERRLSSGDDATELVRFAGAHGALLGPFVRKRLPLETGLGTSYEELWRAQQQGRRFLHLPRIAECYKTASDLVVVREYLPGETLDELVRRRSASPALARELFPQLCDAVTEFHEVCDPPLIHRDLKPRNIIVAPAGIFLIDFGIARRYRADGEVDTVRFGTRAYAPPEQYGFGQTDVRSDTYALGVLLWYCLTGQEPTAHLERDIVLAQVPAPMADVVCRATALDPDARFQSAADLRQAFLAAVGDGLADEGSAGEIASAADPTPAKRRLGIVRNVALAVLALAFVPASINGVTHPTGANVNNPVWYNALVCFGFCIPFIGGGLYLLMDRATLARVIPAIGRRTRRRDTIVWLIYLGIAFVALVIASGVSGA